MRTIVITGTRKGIGKAIAVHYLAEGFKVIGCSRGNASIKHANYQHFSLDVSDEEAVVDMARAIRESHGKIDALLNNAGIASMNHALLTPGETVMSSFSSSTSSTISF